MKNKNYKKYAIFDPDDEAGGQRSVKAYKKWKKKANNKKVRKIEKNKINEV